MAKICLSLTAGTIKRDLEILEKYRKFTDIAELRVDCLQPDERFLIRNFPEQAGLPVILTIRRSIDGGHFAGGEGARVNLMAQGLAFAYSDRRRNFAYVDIEEDLDVPSLEEAARTFGTRIIRSWYNLRSAGDGLSAKIRDMRRNPDDLVKISVMINSTADIQRVLRCGRECADHDKILVCLGHYGVYSRILAEKFGSFLSYAGALSEPDLPEWMIGQIDVQKLAGLYRFRDIKASTKVYGILGNSLEVTDEPPFFNTVFKLEGIDAVYVPFPADSAEAFTEIADELDVSGFSVTAPYKEDIVPFLSEQSLEVQETGICNTVSRCSTGWKGTNTGTRGFSNSLLDFLGKKDLKWKKITVIGAGSTARTVTREIHRLGGKALVLNRNIQKARELAVPYKFAWGSLDSRGIEMIEKYSDIIIKAETTGIDENDSGDPLNNYPFLGRETVMDLINKSTQSPFLQRAERSGCRILDGSDMLTRQAQFQYAQFVGREFPRQYISRVQFGRSE